jgi:hypothetical protein
MVEIESFQNLAKCKLANYDPSRATSDELKALGTSNGSYGRNMFFIRAEMASDFLKDGVN